MKLPINQSKSTLSKSTLLSRECGEGFVVSSDSPLQNYQTKIGCLHDIGANGASIAVSVLILALNEQENIGQVISEARAELDRLKLTSEIVVVDGGSDDNTREEAAAAGARVVKQEDRGFSQGLILGLRSVRGDIIITMDGDCSHSASLIPELMNMQRNADVVIGSRWIPGGSFEGPLLRHLLSRLLNSVFKWLLAVPVSDVSSGYRLYKRKVLDSERYKSKDFSIQVEVLIEAFCDGYSIKEVPLRFRQRSSGSSHVHLPSFAWSFLMTLGRMWKLRHDSNAADYDHRAFDSWNLIQRWWQRSRFQNIRGLLGRFQTEGAVLDVGCGSSRIIQSLPHAVAFDLSLKKLRFLSASNPLRVRGSTFNLPFADASFDCVIHSQLIEHLPMTEDLFLELRRVTKSEGTLIIGTVDYGNRYWPIIEKIYGIVMPYAYADEHISHYTLQSLKDIVERIGYTIEEVKTIPGGEITVKATLCHKAEEIPAVEKSGDIRRTED